MKIRILFLKLLFLAFVPSANHLYAQDMTTQVFVIDHTNPGEALEEISLPPSRLEGSFYLEEDWQLGNVYLKSNQLLKNFPLKYDLENDLLELKTHEDIKVCNPEKLQKFEWEDKATGKYRVFINSAQFITEDGVPLSGVFEVLVDGEVSLLQKTTVKVIKSTYVPTVDVGQRNDRISRKEKFYLRKENRVYEIRAKENKNLALLENCPGLEAFIDTQNYRFNEKEDLIQIVHHYNQCQ